MNSAGDFDVFARWADAPSYAFGARNQLGIVPAADKEAYWRIYEDLLAGAAAARASHPMAGKLYLRPKNYSRLRGSRGHRPRDLWVSLCAEGAETFGHMPQVYVIASERGVELGFAVSIAEDDYFDAEAKERNRAIVPFINSKLPDVDDPLVGQLDAVLSAQGSWLFNRKTRLLPSDPGFGEFSSLQAMIGFLKVAGAATGGGTVARLYGPRELASVDLTAELRTGLDNFWPLLARCAPTYWDIEVRRAQTAVEEMAGAVKLAPASEEEGRRRVWAEVARRQGQGAFRRDLLEAYDGACAISGVNVSDVLQAAHIKPYNGPSTNRVSNGLLLRADLHNLFDLKLISIHPNSMRVVVSPRLKETDYWQLDGRQLRLPAKPGWRPSSQALANHFSEALGDQGGGPALLVGTEPD